MLDVINNDRGPNMGVWVDLYFNTKKYMNVNELTYGNDYYLKTNFVFCMCI
jgi:hypothetical protein